MVVIFAEMIWLSVEQQEYCPSNYERIDQQEDYQNAEATIYASEEGIFRSLWKWGGYRCILMIHNKISKNIRGRSLWR